jgi:hypothetical protein
MSEGKEMTNDGDVDYIPLLNCPFCGSNAEKIWKGNANTKSRSVTIKCKKLGCTTKQTTKSLGYGFDWLNVVASERWNKRVQLDLDNPAT